MSICVSICTPITVDRISSLFFGHHVYLNGSIKSKILRYIIRVTCIICIRRMKEKIKERHVWNEICVKNPMGRIFRFHRDFQSFSRLLAFLRPFSPVSFDILHAASHFRWEMTAFRTSQRILSVMKASCSLIKSRCFHRFRKWPSHHISYFPLSKRYLLTVTVCLRSSSPVLCTKTQQSERRLPSSNRSLYSPHKDINEGIKAHSCSTNVSSWSFKNAASAWYSLENFKST